MVYTLIFIAILSLDQFAKYYISHNFELFRSYPLIENVLYLTYIHNFGAAFGILQNFKLMFILITTFISIVILYYLFKLPKQNRLLKTALVFVLAGGLGNLIDRIALGYVIDFIDFRIWPIFNVADSSIVVGAILIGWYILFSHKTVEDKKLI